MVNRGEKKVRVHMNVVPRSTMNTNGGTEQNRTLNMYPVQNYTLRIQNIFKVEA